MIGLRTVQPNAAVIKVMSIPDNRCIRVVIPDDNVGTDEFHKVLIHNITNTNTPYVAVSDFGSLCLDWPKAIFSYGDDIRLTWNICAMNTGSASVMSSLDCVRIAESSP